MPVSRAKVIVNPVAGGGSIRRQWPQIYRQLHDVGLSFDHEFTKGPDHAIEIAKRAIDTGYRYLVAVGGDGTVNEVANGILNSDHPCDTILGIISAGTACSFTRSLNIAQDYDGACSLLTGQGRISIDVGVVECWNRGRPLRRIFVNEASIGFGAAVVNAWRRLPNRFGHTINSNLRTLASYSVLLTHQNKWIKLRMENVVEDICACYIVVANGRYFAGKMQIAPSAVLDDGLLDLVTIGDVSKSELLKIVPTVYDGNHIGQPKITERKTTGFTIESLRQLSLEADGEVVGSTPASFSVMPSSLSIVV